jgi:hypothetical protein
MRPLLLLLLCPLLAACASPARKHSAWDDLRYRDNDADYRLPSTYSCADDAPSCP